MSKIFPCLGLAALLWQTPGAAGVWTADTPMATARGQHAGVLLDDGSVAVFNGVNSGGFVTGGERYARGVWEPIAASGFTGNVTEAVTLGTGQVLVRHDGSAQAVLFDPVANAWLPGGTQTAVRSLPSMTLLPDGKVLVAGGTGGGVHLASAELYDPQTRTWAATGSMARARNAHAAVLLGDGRVLVASGYSGSGEVPGAEIYNPATGTWSIAALPLVLRHYASLNLLPDGRALLAGGYAGAGVVTTHAEIYSPADNTWTATGAMKFQRSGAMGSPLAHATVLPSGQVLMVGGSDAARVAHPEAEIYDHTTGAWTPDGSMGVGRENGSAHLLPDGDVLLTGGFAETPSTTFYASVERYTPDVPAGSAPVVDAVPLLQRAGMALTLTGAGFTGASGTSTPQLHLQRVENGAIRLWSPASHTDAVFTSPPLGTLPAGLYMARVVVDGIPSAAQLVRFTTPAGTPAATPGNAQATVNWPPHPGTGGNPSAGYAVTASPGGAGCIAVAPATSCTVIGLTNGTPYTFTVRAQHPNGEGPVSAVSAPVTPTAVGPGPGAVPVPGLSPAAVALTALAAAALAGLGRRGAGRRRG
ncbi:kelch repeat-containing protein [Acidovorax sp. MR-S7]|uniref:kelch repeat-containing protein n=1 Tax=Acidovorax sp. MR-S7 TaxID=1268622 RepID=UPI00036130CE|nr:kelch repeat-containing protein [Acidovorax sp. MR-S7]GAD24499.1 hypothetical protein AVS7_04259 [Acidovorax sp. MR-S7]